MTRGNHSFRKALALGGFMVAYVVLFYFIIAMKAEAQGAPTCGPEQEIMAMLKDQYREEATGGGGILLPTGQTRLEIFASADGDSFTVVIFGVDGRACMVFAGVDWEPGVVPASGQEM